MGGGSSTLKKTQSTREMRLAPYLEVQHKAFLNSVKAEKIRAERKDPYADGYTEIPIETAFFGVGYALSSFPSLYDMYGKFMAGVDIRALYNELEESTVNSPAVSRTVTHHAELLRDEIEDSVNPVFHRGRADICSVMIGSYYNGDEIIREKVALAVDITDKGLKYAAHVFATSRWQEHLKWNETVVKMDMALIQMYLSSKMDTEETKYAILNSQRLFNLDLLDLERAALGAMSGAISESGESKTEVEGKKKWISYLGTALSLASMAASAYSGGGAGSSGGGIMSLFGKSSGSAVAPGQGVGNSLGGGAAPRQISV